jgi:hypothetical protein
MLKGLLMLLRLLWLVVLLTGALFYFHIAVPISLHIYMGFAIGALMIVIAIIGFRGAGAALSAITILVAIVLPVIGIMQLKRLTMPDLPYIQITHVVIGIAAIALAEIVGKRARLAGAA